MAMMWKRGGMRPFSGSETDRAIEMQEAILTTLYRAKETYTMSDRYESQQLFNFLTEHADTITTGTATRLIAEFGADFNVEDIL